MPTVRAVLAAQGVDFKNGFLTTPLCCPSRVSILTGEYVHNHEVYTDRYPQGGARKFDDKDTLAVRLQAGGYKTAYMGKYLNDYEALMPLGYVPPGWDEWDAFLEKNLSHDEDAGSAQYYLRFTMSENGKPVEYRSKANFSADVLTRKAVDFIAENRDQPFMLMIGYYNPHSPFLFADRHIDAFRRDEGLDPWRSPNLNEADISDKPKYLQELHPFSETELDATYRRMLRSLLSVDDGVASILNVLDQANLKEKTIIVYLSDNGLTVGDHRFGLSKNCPYDECIRTPFLVYAPGRFPARSDGHLVANIDLAPTLCDLAGTEPPAAADGASLVPLLSDPKSAWRDAILIEHWPTEEGIGAIIPAFSGVRTAAWKYVEYSTGEMELYDLQADPYETRNLAGKAAYSDIMKGLQERLAELKGQ